MSIPETRSLRITVLSPVHMGTDEDYAPTNYVIDGGTLHALGLDAVTHLPDDARRDLAQIVKGNVRGRELLAIQALFHRSREALMPHATHRVEVGEGVEDLYKARIGKVAQHERGGWQVQNRLEIERAFYNPVSQSLVLAGSGLKGAIRTALLNERNGGASLPEDLSDSRARDGSGVARQASRNLQERLFGYSMREKTLHRDPMRLVHLADAAAAREERRVLFAVNRRRKRGEHQSRAEEQGLYQLLECAMPGAAFSGELRIMPLPPRDAPGHRYGFRQIAAVCQRFYATRFNAEFRALQVRGLLGGQWKRAMTRILRDEGLKRRFREGRAFLLRAGRHSGAESVTLDGVRRIRIMQGGGEATWESEPKTWWLAAERGKDQADGLLPFGWLLVEEDDGDLPRWADAFDASSSDAVDMKRKLDELKKRGIGGGRR